MYRDETHSSPEEWTSHHLVFYVIFHMRACLQVLAREHIFLRISCVPEDYNFLASFHQPYLQSDWSHPSDPESTPHISAFSACVLEQWRKGIFWLFPGILQVT